jgi:hypothetical protein
LNAGLRMAATVPQKLPALSQCCHSFQWFNFLNLCLLQV